MALDGRVPASGQSSAIETSGLGRSAWMAVLALQLATTTALVMRVVGFHYP
jgi:hypothetical protein